MPTTRWGGVVYQTIDLNDYGCKRDCEHDGCILRKRTEMFRKSFNKVLKKKTKESK